MTATFTLEFWRSLTVVLLTRAFDGDRDPLLKRLPNAVFSPGSIRRTGMDDKATCWHSTKDRCQMQIPLDHFVIDKVISAIERTIRIGQKKVTLHTKLTPDLALSGFGKLKLAILLEEIFNVELSNERVEQFATVFDIVKYIGLRCLRDVEPLQVAEVA